MSGIKSKSKQEEHTNARMLLVDHAAEGKKYLERGLQLIRNGDVSDAADAFFHAAVEFEKAQNFRQISALWEAIGKLSEPEGDAIPHVTERWPLDYHVMKTDSWHKQKNKEHKLAWVYGWAAEHRERAGDPFRAYPLFFKSAEWAEQTKDNEKDAYWQIEFCHSWPAEFYRRAALNFIRVYGTIEHAPDVQHIKKGFSDKELVKKGIKRMKEHYKAIKDRTEGYRSLGISYRLLKSNLIERGDPAEAEQYKRKERSALTHYYFRRRSYFHAVTEWLSGGGFMYFIIGLFLMISFVFPYIYYQWNLVAPLQGKITYSATILYSIESALGVGHKDFYAIGYGRLLNIIEAALSWLGLGMFIWWVTRRLE